MKVHAVLVSLALAAACPGGTGDPPPDDELTAWKGEEPHFAVQGTLNGEELDLELEGDEVVCAREYEVPSDGAGGLDYENGEQVEVRVRAPFTVDGEERVVELEMKKHSLQTDDEGAEVGIVPRDDTADPGPSDMWLEWEWHLASDDSDLYEAAAEDGSFTLHKYEGEPGADGLVVPEGEGLVAGFVDAQWGADEALRISFTAPCTENEVVELTE